MCAAVAMLYNPHLTAQITTLAILLNLCCDLNFNDRVFTEWSFRNKNFLARYMSADQKT